MTTFDWYLLKRFIHIFSVILISLFGLYVTIDAFQNADDFLQKGSVVGAFQDIAQFYGYRAAWFLDLIGGAAAVMAAMVTFALVQRNGELNPVLSAGISTYRLVWPMLWGTVVVLMVLAANRELIIPNIANELQLGAGATGESHAVEPVYDQDTMVFITAAKLNIRSRRIELAEFLLPTGVVDQQPVTVRALSAVFLPALKTRPTGWMLTDVDHPYEKLQLTESGQSRVYRGPTDRHLFVVSGVTFDRLYQRDRNFEMLSTWDLMQRLKSRSFSRVSIRKQSLHLHARMTKPLQTLIAVLLGLPLVARKGATGLMASLAYCSMALGTVNGLEQAFGYLGSTNLIGADLAAWGSIILSGTAAAWVSWLVRT